MSIRQFVLVRDEDVSGVSGTGTVAEGVEFSRGTCVLSWLSNPHSIGVYQSVDELLSIHGHNGKTHVRWTSPEKEACMKFQTV